LHPGDAYGRVRVRFAVFVCPAAVPVTVSVYVPAGEDLDVQMFRFDKLVVTAGLSVAVTPLGSPLTPSATALVKPYRRLTFAEDQVYCPRPIVRLVGVRPSENVGAST